MAWAENNSSKESPEEGILEWWRARPPRFHPALIVIDMQNGYCAEGGSYERFGADINIYRKIIPNVKSIIDICHELSVPVFYTQQVREASGIDLLTRMHHIIPRRRLEFIEKIPSCVRGTWDAGIIDELAPQKNDHIVEKRRDSAFQDTEFELWLKSIGADTVIYTGIDTCICVENSLREGFNKGYDVILVEDAVTSSWPDLHNATLQMVKGSFGLVLTTEKLIDVLYSSKRGTSSFSLSMENL